MMGREVRRVPADWQHPKDEQGRYIPLLDGYETALKEFEADIESKGLAEAIDYWGGGPLSYDYMLVGVPDEQRTHYMMYENTSEGSPLSPACETPEELARWLADNNASFFGKMPTSYAHWLDIARGGYGNPVFSVPADQN